MPCRNMNQECQSQQIEKKAWGAIAGDGANVGYYDPNDKQGNQREKQEKPEVGISVIDFICMHNGP